MSIIKQHSKPNRDLRRLGTSDSLFSIKRIFNFRHGGATKIGETCSRSNNLLECRLSSLAKKLWIIGTNANMTVDRDFICAFAIVLLTY